MVKLKVPSDSIPLVVGVPCFADIRLCIVYIAPSQPYGVLQIDISGKIK